jgi:CBS domain-containing protein
MRVRDAARRLIDRSVGRLIVVDGGQVVGVLSRHDVLRALTRTSEELLHAVEGAVDAVHASSVGVSVDPGCRVRLTGATGDQASAARAVDAAMRVDGVSGVDNDLTWDGQADALSVKD